MSDFDGLIAAIARLRESVVVTHNPRHFEEPGIGTVDWPTGDMTGGT